MKKKILLIFILVLVVYITLLFSPIYIMRDYINNFSNITITSHRGAGGLAPENTISSIKEGLKYNSDRIEIDVHQTLDDTLIIMHDKSIDRTTNGKGEIKNLRYDELEKYSAGIKFSDEFINEKIPTLYDVLSTINGKSKLLIEIKYGSEIYPNIENNIIEIIEKYGAIEWCIIQSFDIKILKKINQLNPNIEIHKLSFGKLPFFNVWISNTIEFENILKYDFIKEISIAYPFANKRIITKIHKSGKKINVWTVDNKKRIGQLIELGIDGITTNYPNYFNEIKIEKL